MLKCKNLTKKVPEEGSPIFKCSKNNKSNNFECYLKIKEILKENNFMPDGECPFANRNISLLICPCFEQ